MSPLLCNSAVYMFLTVANPSPPPLQYYQQTDAYRITLHYMNTTLTGLFTLEVVMKIFSFGFRVRPQGSSINHINWILASAMETSYLSWLSAHLGLLGHATMDFEFQVLCPMLIHLLFVSSKCIHITTTPILLS